jgi:hypothetical protein
MTALQLNDLVLLAVVRRGVGTDEDLTEAVVDLLRLAGMGERAWSWQLGSEGRWYLEQVAEYTSRLMDLGWATPARNSALTPVGIERCAEILRTLLDDPDKGPQLQALVTRLA